MKIQELLFEGGNAIKTSVSISQKEAKEIVPKVIELLQSELKCNCTLIGSATFNPENVKSNDIDIAIDASVDQIKKWFNESTFKHKEMPGINVYSFEFIHGDKSIQIDLFPTNNLKFVEFSMRANPKDLIKGYKAAHRNEVFFAIARNITDYVDGDDYQRPIFDLSKGLFLVNKSKQGKRGIKKNYSNTSKEFLTDDPDEIVKFLFGESFNAKDVDTFEKTLELINTKEFKYSEKLDKILKDLKEGLSKKGLNSI